MQGIIAIELGIRVKNIASAVCDSNCRCVCHRMNTMEEKEW